MKIQKRDLVMSGIITGADKEGQPLHTFAVCAYKFCLIWRLRIRSPYGAAGKDRCDLLYLHPSPYIEKNYKEICGSSLCAGGREQHQGGLAVCLA